MSTIIMYFLGGVICLVILDKIPGLKHLIKPVIDFITFCVTFFFENIGSWLMWILKTMARSHYVLAVHLLKTRDELEPTEKIEDINKHGGNFDMDEG